jgi:hypothetical protein
LFQHNGTSVRRYNGDLKSTSTAVDDDPLADDDRPPRASYDCELSPELVAATID